ncbi:MAG: hypothetical protein OXD00_04120, partial [Gammaproteobacteria bacterium]|nr:hypothetical protein [Gammaproteobacteria bacterium]
ERTAPMNKQIKALVTYCAAIDTQHKAIIGYGAALGAFFLYLWNWNLLPAILTLLWFVFWGWLAMIMNLPFLRDQSKIARFIIGSVIGFFVAFLLLSRRDSEK